MKTTNEEKINNHRELIQKNAKALSEYIRVNGKDSRMDTVQDYVDTGRRLDDNMRRLAETDSQEIKVVSVCTDLKKALVASAEAYGLGAYADSEFDRKVKLHKRYGVQKYYVDENGGIWYTIQVPHEPGRILHKFSWIGSLTAGSAAIAEIDEDSVRIFTKRQDRNDLRNDPNVALWTTEYIR